MTHLSYSSTKCVIYMVQFASLLGGFVHIVWNLFWGLFLIDNLHCRAYWPRGRSYILNYAWKAGEEKRLVQGILDVLKVIMPRGYERWYRGMAAIFFTCALVNYQLN